MSLSSGLSTLKIVGFSLLVIVLSPLWIFLALPMILAALFTAPLAFAILSSRVWLVYLDYFLTLFYRAVMRPSRNEVERSSSCNPGEITRRYDLQNFQQYSSVSTYGPTSPLHSPPTLFSPEYACSRTNSSQYGEDMADTADAQRTKEAQNMQQQSSLDADMDSVGVWEDIAAVAQRRSERRRRSSSGARSAIANAYLQQHDPGVGILPSIAAQHTEFAHPRRRRSSGARHEDILRMREDAEPRREVITHGDE